MPNFRALGAGIAYYADGADFSGVRPLGGEWGNNFEGAALRSVSMKIALVALAIGLTAASAYAQGTGSGGRHSPRAAPKKDDRPKADDKAYRSALKGLPDKQYDPWHGVR
jgi:hypothetical protein